MNDTLTYEILEEMFKSMAQLKRRDEKFDVILLTTKEEQVIRDLVPTTKPTEPHHFFNQICGIRYETYFTKERVLKRAEELIKDGKRVMVIEDEY